MAPGTNNSMMPILVIILVPLAFILAPLVLDGLSEPPARPSGPKPTITLSAGDWSGTSIAMVITSVSSSSFFVEIVSFQVLARNGTRYFSGAAGSSDPVSGVVTTVTYTDVSGDGVVRADDTIAVSVDDPAGVSLLQQATFKIVYGPDVLGTEQVP